MKTFLVRFDDGSFDGVATLGAIEAKTRLQALKTLKKAMEENRIKDFSFKNVVLMKERVRLTADYRRTGRGWAGLKFVTSDFGVTEVKKIA
jgi:hypothetical protein